jgi:histidyl-tRNA synthetase
MEGTRLVAPMLARALRQVYTVDYDLEGRGLNAQMKAADKSGARAVMLLGDEEWQRGEVVLKELKTGAQQTVPLDGIVEALDRILLGETAGTEAP